MPEPPPDVTDEHDPQVTEAQPKTAFAIVGVGASAGGLEALSQLLRAVPPDTGLAFVLVQHLAPTHPSLLASILSRATSMSVIEVSDEPRVKPNCVYVIPPNRTMSIANGRLELGTREGSPGQQRPIDDFFSALARDQRERAIGVILSGGGSDGTLGLEEIKAEGGLTFAQDDSAEFQSMPRSAIAAGCVDIVAEPSEIGGHLERIARNPLHWSAAFAPASMLDEVGNGAHLDRVLDLLRRDGDPDFVHYRRSTLERRVRRRMVLWHIDRLDDYARYLGDNPDEIRRLRNDILIGVTSFFRNEDAFRFLASSVFPRITETRSRHEPIRGWCVGCSSGEESYSLAMAYQEFSEAAGVRVPLKLFASDVNPFSISKARTGLYPRSIERDVSPERLDRFFVKTDEGYRVTTAIRESCVFAEHDVLSDPPFSHVDFVSCRNVLIYLEPSLQQRVAEVLLYALNPGGFLWLGTSETMGNLSDLVEVESPEHRVFRKRSLAGAATLPRPAIASLFPVGHTHRRRISPSPDVLGPRVADAQREADRIAIARYSPPSVLINENLDILQFRGDGSLYLGPSTGQASLNLLKMAREELIVGIRNAVQRAQESEVPARSEGLTFRIGDSERRVDVEVSPIRAGVLRADHFLVTFEESEPPAPADAPNASADGRLDGGRDHERVRQELAAAREYLTSVIDQNRVAHQDLQTAYEEIQSSNEELQSINEELETSKEEIQSANEELITVNDELRNRNLELIHSNADFTNLLGSVQLAIVMLGPDLRIRRFTRPAEKLLNLIPPDVGRPITDISINLDLPDLESMLRGVIESLTVKELTLRARSGRWHSLRIHPYLNLDGRIDGVVMVLVDIDDLKIAQEGLRESEERLRLLVEGGSGYAIMLLDPDGRVQSWNVGASRLFGYSDDEVLGSHISKLFANGDIGGAIPAGSTSRSRVPVTSSYESWLVRKDGTRFWASGSTSALRDPFDNLRGFGVIVQDNTERKEFEEQLREHVEELSERDRMRGEFLAMLAHEIRNPLATLRNATDALRVDEATSETTAVAHELMSRQITHMSRMIDDLLDISRLAHGKMEIHRQPVDLVEAVRDAAQVNEAMIAERSQTLHLSLPSHPMFVSGDPTRLEQVFANLIQNASKYGRDGGGIWIELDAGDPPPGGVAEVGVSVRDDGTGIAEELLPKIFDLFTQADSSLARERGGLGIGLSLVKRLVELHGGTVAVSSDGADTGSEFVVRLPRRDNVLERPRSAPRGGELRRGEARDVLVVDDNRDAAESLALVLSMSGHRTSVASSSEAALAVEPGKFQVAIIDIGMPGMNGLELAAALRERGDTPRPLLIALTGYGDSEMRSKIRQAGFDHHVVKPGDSRQLLHLIAESHSGAG